MTLLSVVRDVCATVGVALPSSVFSGITGNRTAQEMLTLANEMAQRIAYETREWTKLKVTTAFDGDGAVTVLPGDPPEGMFRGTTGFNLPENYKRMLLKSNVWRSTSTQQPMRFIQDTDEWLVRRIRNASASAWGEWTLIGGMMHIFPIMPVGTSASFVYLDKNCIALASGGNGDRFVSDADSFVLDERLLKLGMIWQWMMQKGSPYQEQMSTYEDALAYMQGSDSPAPILIDSPLAGGWDANYVR